MKKRVFGRQTGGSDVKVNLLAQEYKPSPEHKEETLIHPLNTEMRQAETAFGVFIYNINDAHHIADALITLGATIRREAPPR